jgi:HNH endonuclease
MRKEQGGKETILAAIRRAAAELGRAPSRGELRRITGVSHYRVLAVFPTLREAVRAAGLEPNPKGEKISTEDLLADWKRVAEKLGRRPSRAEYVREGKYSAGALTVRFGSWSGISTAKVAKSAKEIRISRELTRRTRINQKPERANHKGHEGTRGKRSDDLKPGAAIRVQRGLTKPEEWNKEGATQSLLRDFDRAPLAAVPAPVVGMRRVTEEVAQMVVNTLLAPGSWQLAISQNQNREFNHKGHPYDSSFASSESLRAGYGTQRKSRTERETCDFADRMRLAPRGVNKEGDLGPSLAVNAPLVQDDRWRRADFTARGLYKDRPVMGEPFDRRPMTNAPVNELGVMVLFGMVAAGLGLQVESVQGKFPDCIAKRQVAPGKWQYLRIEFEYESKNFKLHGHDPKGCDMIVCWKHNWKDVPDNIEVIELCRLIG